MLDDISKSSSEMGCKDLRNMAAQEVRGQQQSFHLMSQRCLTVFPTSSMFATSGLVLPQPEEM